MPVKIKIRPKTKMKREPEERFFLPFVRMQYSIQVSVKDSARKKTPKYIGEVRAWVNVRKVTPYRDFSKRYLTYEDWLKSRKKVTSYSKRIIAEHKLHPTASLTQLGGKAKKGELKITDVKKTIPQRQIEETKERLRRACNWTLLLQNMMNGRTHTLWVDSMDLEEDWEEQELDTATPLNFGMRSIYYARDKKEYDERGIRGWEDELQSEGKLRKSFNNRTLEIEEI